MSNLAKLRKVFSKSIAAKAKSLSGRPLTKIEMRRVRESISDDIRKFTDLITPMVSKMADVRAQKMKVELDKVGWHDQRRFDPGRKIFHLEHFYTVKSIKESCSNASEVWEINEILTKTVRVVWILKKEDRRLTALGHGRVRKNPEKAYEEAGIEIVK